MFDFDQNLGSRIWFGIDDDLTEKDNFKFVIFKLI